MRILNETSVFIRRGAMTGLLILFLAAGSSAQSAGLEYGSLPRDGHSVTNPVAIPLAPHSITQNLDPNTLSPGSVACVDGGVTTENSWFRLFDLDDDHGISEEFCVESVDYGIETAVDLGVPQSIAVTTACLDDGLPYLHAFLSEQATHTHAQPDADFEFFNVIASGCCDGETQSMSIELEAALDCSIAGCGALYIGMNDLGQIAPTYIESASCGLTEPYDLNTPGFPYPNLVMVVHGLDAGGCCVDADGAVDGPVPASNGLGLLLIALLLLGSSAYFTRR